MVHWRRQKIPKYFCLSDELFAARARERERRSPFMAFFDAVLGCRPYDRSFHDFGLLDLDPLSVVCAAAHGSRARRRDAFGLSADQTRAAPSAQASASAKTAWIIAVNKPIYPAYVWYFVGSGLWAASITAITLPLYVGIAMLLRSRPRVLRFGVPLLGLFDTVLAVKLLGAASGAELFFFPCLMLATLAPETGETRASRGLVATIFLLALALHGHYGPPLRVWDADALDRLREVNILSVACLCAFLGWSFAERLRLPSERR
jgi:hypothetical protein